jgi:K+-transporting ATPase ATPase C chain
MLIGMTLLTGLAYPLAFTGLAQVTLNERANGSILEHDGRVVGSSLLGQAFTEDEYFHPRPSAADYDPRSSSGSNLGPTNPNFLAMIEARVREYREVNGLDGATLVPVDAVTSSASGLDPHISKANAVLQAPRVADARGSSLESVLQLIEDQGAQEGGAGYVNVLELNIALEEAGS